MAFPNPDYSKRDYLLPDGCKDLADLIRREAAAVSPPRPDPPITRRVTLPGVVSVKFIAEATGQSLHKIANRMNELRIIVSVNRSIEFDDAVRILRRYGIGADRAA